jgi:NTP pyrophosphatase (non-canonical NTP hydrolase)
MLGLASETGSILDSYKRYLRDAIDLNLNRAFLRVELGDLLWYVAVVASACGLSVTEIANANLVKVRGRYRGKFPGKTPNIGCFVQLDTAAPTNIAKDFNDYQFEASRFSELNLRGPESLIAPLCGLAGATGAILKVPTDKSGALDSRAHKHVFRTELGDLLWYLSIVATASNLNLGDIAEENLVRARDLYPVSTTPPEELFKTLPKLDDPQTPTECFPRRMVIRFDEEPTQEGYPVVTQSIVYAEPNAFPRGPTIVEGKSRGFAINAPLGDQTDDNSRRADGYRYHDAIHMGFMAVLGWSPTMRALLHLKRKSENETDRTEDGARARFTEEGLATILARLAPRRMDFQGENSVDGEILDTAHALVRDTEIQSLPGWLWRRAISQGFVAMHQLDKNRGGYLLADLDMRTLTYSKVKPDVTAKKRH